MIKTLNIRTKRQGLVEITEHVADIVRQSGVSEGLCVVLLQHTSASLIIQENADPSARADLESWINRLVSENDPNYTHTMEGPDDMPSHIKSVLTQPSIAIPVLAGELALGTWQGLYLWEHRAKPHTRNLVVYVKE